MRCDNCTHFTGTKSELQRSLSGMDEEKIWHFPQNSGNDWVKWKNNHPWGSHMWRAYECQIKSAHVILSALLKQHSISSNKLIITWRSWINCKFKTFKCRILEWYWKWSSAQSNQPTHCEIQCSFTTSCRLQETWFVYLSMLEKNSAYYQGILVVMARVLSNSAK